VQLTRRGLFLLLATAPLLALAAWKPWFGWVAGGWLVVAVALLLADWWLAPAPRDWEASRSHDKRLSLATGNPIRITVRLHGGLRPTPIWLRDEPPAPFALTPTSRVLQATVTPGAAALFAYLVTPPRRGDYHFGNLHLRWQAPLGLLRRQTILPAAAPVLVYPNLADVRKVDLLMRRNRLWEMGLRPMRVPGRGSDYDRLRDYLPDDDYRRINWKATARRGKPITTDYQAERNQNITMMLDVGRMMRSPVGEVAKLDYAINAVLLLAWVATRKGDNVGLLTFAGAPIHWVEPKSGSDQFFRLLEILYAVEAQPVEPDYAAAFVALESRLRKHSLLLLFTELTGSISNEQMVVQLQRVRRRHLPLLVTVGDPTVEQLARQPITGSSSLYERTQAELLLSERQLAIDRLQATGVPTLDATADTLSVAVINRYLALRERELR
jgi:uncharacterized protein (DUF58 family)